MLRSSIILAVAWVTVGHVTYTQSQQRDDPTGPASHHGEEWPRWRGPRGNGTWHAPKLLDKWPAGGLQRTWATPLGGGYAGVAAKGQRIFTMDRQTTPQDRERVVCLHASDGKPLWTHEYPINYGKLEYGNGPRATPTIYDNRVYTLGALGHLWCLDAANGKPFWTAQLARDYQGRMPTWGYAASPLVVGDLVIVQPGGKGGQSVVALNRKTGSPVWKTLSDEAAYATPILIKRAGQSQLICWTPSHVRGLEPETGKLIWAVPYQVTMGVSIATPIFEKNILFVSGYWEGSKAIRLGGNSNPAELLWEENRHLRGLMSQPLYRNGLAYLLDKQHGMICFDFATGKKIWDDGNRATPRGRNPQATLVWINQGDRALILNSAGELILAQLNRAGYQELARAKVVSKTWAHPAYAADHIFARSDRELVAVQLPVATKRSFPANR